MPKIPTIFRFALSILIASIAVTAHAGEYSMGCFFATKKCGSTVVDLVSERFTTRYPATKWEIVVLAEFTPYLNGGGVGYSIAGVSRKVAGTQQPTVPRHRFVSTSRRTGEHISLSETQAEVDQLVRDSIEQMMAACANSPNCNID